MRDMLLGDPTKKEEGTDNNTLGNIITSRAETANTPNFLQSLNDTSTHSHNHSHDHNHSHSHSHSHDHNEEMPSTITSTATKKLTLVCCVCSVFMLIEFFGGLLSDSIAIMTDAAHLLSDLTGFLISIYALYISNKKPDANFTFGYHRAEIVGAVSSVFIIWILTSLLLVESIARLFDSHHNVNGKIMLITSSIGLVFNGVMAYVLHSGGEGGHNHHHHDCHGHGEQVHSLLKKEEHHHHHEKCSHDHEKHYHHHQEHEHEHGSHCHHAHNIIIEDINEDGGSLNDYIKNKGTNASKLIEMNNIDTNPINKISDTTANNNPSQFIQIQTEISKTFDDNELRKTKKESQVLFRNNIKSEFENIDQDNFKKRKSENITLKHKKWNRSTSTSLPHVPKQLTRDHSKLHKLGAFIGLIDHDEEDNCSNDHHNDEVSFHTISFNDSSKENNDTNQLLSALPDNSPHHHKHGNNTNSNINVQAAFIHIIGDIIQSIGVIIAASLIYFFPTYQIIDPLTTILFSIIVVTTTIPIIKQCVYAIMEGNTNVEDFTMIKNELLNLPGVISVCCFHLYYLSLDKAVLCAHIKVIQSVNECELLKRIYAELSKYKIYHCTIEISKEDSNTCSNMMEII